MSKRPDPVDWLIAANIHFHRMRRRMSQAYLAGRLKVSFQQVQKYESALNRVSASRLFRIAKALGVPIASFFERSGLTENNLRQPSPCGASLVAQHETIRLMCAFQGISNARLRHALVHLVKDLTRT